MKPLLKLFLFFTTFFTVTFLAFNLTGVLTVEHFKSWLTEASELSPLYAGALVATVLFLDLFVAVPALTITILSGYFLGHLYGAASALTGIILAGVCGYTVSPHYGGTVMNYLIKDEVQRNQAVSTFKQYGFVMILLSRAIPLLPEVTACLSGMTRMPFGKFMLAWLLSSVPYVFIISYSGSISSIDNLSPAIYTALGISALLSLSWFLYQRNRE